MLSSGVYAVLHGLLHALLHAMLRLALYGMLRPVLRRVVRWLPAGPDSSRGVWAVSLVLQLHLVELLLGGPLLH